MNLCFPIKFHYVPSEFALVCFRFIKKGNKEKGKEDKGAGFKEITIFS